MGEWSLWKHAALVFLGGGLGAAGRWSVNRALVGTAWAQSFPWVTFGINVAGSFLLGLCVVAAKGRPAWYALLGTGLCGGFTTFSTFSVELLKLVEDDRPAAAAGYAGGSVLAALAGAWLGTKVLRA